MKRFCGVRCDVLGFGISNRPLVTLLWEAGAQVTVYDAKSMDALGQEAEQWQSRGVRFVCGEHAFDALGGEVIFRSPGIRPDLPAIAQAVRNGATLLSEMELFCADTPARLFVITGSDGKTTTTTLTHLFLSAQKDKTGNGNAYVGGNIGAPLLPRMAEMSPQDAAVLELSSFQLMGMDHYCYRAAITNVTPNHLNWHTDMREYTEAKQNAIRRATLAVLNADNDITAALAASRGRDMILFSSRSSSYEEVIDAIPTLSRPCHNVAALYLKNGVICYGDGNGEREVLATRDILLPGIHNVENYMTAIALTWGEVDAEIYPTVAKAFGGVPHRLEFVRELRGVRYYNSSIDSSPTRTAAALRALEGGIVAICGGYDKNIPMEPLAQILCQRVRVVVLTGATAQKIKSALLSCPAYRENAPKILEAPLFSDAVAAAAAEARATESVVLSPACASFDAFSNFEERGNLFRDLIMSMA